MWRTVLRPRWLGALLLVLVVMVTFGALGLWQLSVARDQGQAEAVRDAPSQQVVPLSEVVAPHATFPVDAAGRPVTVTGSYDAAGQVLVAGRRLGDRTGLWVVTPLVVDGTGARLAVVRGFVTSAAAASAPPSGPVTVTGALAAGESPAEPATRLPAGQLPALDLSVLVNRWPGDLYNAFVFAAVEGPDATVVSPASSGLTRVPAPRPEVGLQWRNAAYAVQWWIFAIFAAYMWWRMVREEASRTGRAERSVTPRTDESKRPEVSVRV